VATLSGGVLNIPQYAGTSYSAGTGLSLAGGVFSVNTSQNIATLSNLSVAGFVKTTSAGLLSSAALGSSDVTTALGFTPYSATNPAGYISNVTGLVTAGTNVTVSGSGTSGSPYVVNASGGGGSSFAYPFPSNATSTAITLSGGETVGTNLNLSYLSGNAAGGFLAYDPSGNIISTTTPSGGSGTNYFTNSGANTYLSTGTNLGIGTTSPVGTFSVQAFNPTSSSTPPGLIYLQGGTGGLNASGAASPVGSVGGVVDIVGGTGGDTSSTIGIPKGGIGGAVQLTGGTGGVGSGVNGNGGFGGAVSLTGGAGLFGNGYTGNGGNVLLNGGTGTIAGSILTQTSGGVFGIGTSSPFANLSLEAGADFGNDPASTVFAIGSSTAGHATTTLFSMSSTGNINMYGNGINYTGVSGSGLELESAGSVREALSSALTFSAGNLGASAGATTAGIYAFTPAAQSSLPASLANYPVVNFNFGINRARSNGAVPNVSDITLEPTTETFSTGATIPTSTIASATAMTIYGDVGAGALGNITNDYGLFVEGSTTGNIASTTNSYGLAVQANGNAVNNYAAEFLGGNVGIGTTSPGTLFSIQSIANFATNAISFLTGLIVKGPITSKEIVQSYSGTPTFDWSQTNQYEMTLTGNLSSVTFSNMTPGQGIRLILCEDGTGGRTVTGWTAGVLWPSAGVPTQTTTANKCDVYPFTVTSATSTTEALGGAVQNF
jgi:hypothetical protein